MPNQLYDRTVDVYDVTYGKDGANGFKQTATPVLSKVDANVQLITERSGQAKISPGPTDTADAMTLWNIHIPTYAAAKGVIKKGFMIVDDLDEKYVVEAPYWTQFGYQIQARIYHP